MEQGGHVIMADIDEAALERAQAVLGRVRLGTIASPLDTPTECARVIEAAGAPVYALVHLAGLFDTGCTGPGQPWGVEPGDRSKPDQCV